MSPETLLLSVPDVAHMLGISVRYAWTLVYTRQLESVRIGKRRKVNRKEIDRFIQKMTIKTRF